MVVFRGNDVVQVVFVHGVNTRVDAAYAARAGARAAAWKDIAFHGAACELHTPYWGGNAVEPRFGLACIPSKTAAYQQLGTHGRQTSEPLLSAALADFGALVGSLAAAAIEDRPDDPEAGMLWSAAARYVAKLPQPGWVQDMRNDAAFLQRLADELSNEAAKVSLGPLGSLAAAALRLSRSGPDLINGAVAEKVRKHMPSGSAFFGDALSYVHSGTARDHIRAGLSAAIVEVAAMAALAGERLVLVGHSFGGVLLYDLLARPDEVGLGAVKVDLLLTVGSQVGLFEEFGLFDPPDAARAAGKSARPTGVAAWLNIFDHLDLLAYGAAPAFDGVEDLIVDTVAGLANAHTAYFDNPVFYQRLHGRLKGLGLLS